ncbi:MAG: MTH895/ArsE family thioredoxin-like protein [Candidatus Paceibacterota bacterium]|jgi:small redox-active disulfide protein 2
MNNKIEKIEVFGSGCDSCKKLFDLTKKAVTEIGLDAEVEYIDDIQKAMDLGVMSFPVLAINKKPIIIGIIPSMEEIKEAITSYQNGIVDTKEGSSGCSCGGNC